MTIYTIGFKGKTAEEFFGLLKTKKIKRLLDIRLNNTSQLAAFTKKNDLEYFLKEILGAEYIHLTLFAPTQELFEKYKEDKNWDDYESGYKRLLEERKVKENLDMSLFDKGVVLLCSEETAEHCHRRLAAEYIAEKLRGSKIVHL